MRPLQVREVALEAVARARAGLGPTLIEAETYRFRGHSLADPDELRRKEEKEHYAVSTRCCLLACLNPIIPVLSMLGPCLHPGLSVCRWIKPSRLRHAALVLLCQHMTDSQRVEQSAFHIALSSQDQCLMLFEAWRSRSCSHVRGCQCNMSHHGEHAALFASKDLVRLSSAVQARDPIPQLKKVILEGNILTQDELKAIEKDVLAEVDAAVQFAEESPKPVSLLPSVLTLLFASTSACP